MLVVPILTSSGIEEVQLRVFNLFLAPWKLNLSYGVGCHQGLEGAHSVFLKWKDSLRNTLGLSFPYRLFITRGENYSISEV